MSLLMVLLAGCEREPAVIIPPKDAAAVIEPFLKELRAGQRARTAALVSPSAQDELSSKFADDHKMLAAAPRLTPRFVSNLANQGIGVARGEEITLVYAARRDGKWTSATVRAYRDRGEPYRIEYWRIVNEPPALPLPSGMSREDVQMQHQIMYAMFGIVGLFGLVGLALLLWIAKRKPQLISPDTIEETRASAVSVREE